MNIYAAKNHVGDEWINLVLGEDGMAVSCNSFATEEECDYDMVEGTKVKLNARFSEWSEKYNIPLGYFTYKILVVDKQAPEFLEAMALNEKKEARQANFLFRVIDKISFYKTLVLCKLFRNF